jgi:4-amino-4-deoxy-L-arabinose transferase-like glycosyltransferase
VFFYKLYVSMALATLAKGLMGFLVTGAVMFLWLLVFNQWKRLRPLYLPTGALIFLAIALPWHLLAAMRNETWVHRYIVYEHFERFTTTAAGRVQPWHFFIWIVIGGLIPWTGFLWPAVRDALGWASVSSPTPVADEDIGDHPRGASWFKTVWSRRQDNADAWFLVTWVAFVFGFFSISHSKLAPYILPIFPALAVLIGAWLARALEDNAASRLRGGLRVFTFINGLLTVALLTAVLKPGLIRDEAQARALQLPAFALAATLLLGGIFVPWLARIRGVAQAIGGIGAMMVGFFFALQFAAPDINKPGTKSLAEFVRAHAQPGDRVMHYFDFFHDFTFYAKRTVELIGGEESVKKHEFSELELVEDAAAVARGQLISEQKLRELWLQPTRIFVVAKTRDVRESRADGKPPLLKDPTFRYHLLLESRDHCLFSNQP